jgi:hypothetical protein
MLPDLSDLMSLQLLDLSNTRITRLNPSIATLAHLQVLQLISPTPTTTIFPFTADPTLFAQFEYPPSHICCKGIPEIMTYLKQHRVVQRDTNKSGLSDTLYDTTRYSTTRSELGTTISEHGSKVHTAATTIAERTREEAPFPSTSIRHTFNHKLDELFESFWHALTLPDKEEAQNCYQHLMLTFFDSIHLLVVPAFCPVANQGAKNTLSLFTFKLDSFLASFDSSRCSSAIQSQIIVGIVKFTETVLLNALFIRQQIVANFKLFKGSVRTFYQWIQGVAPASPPRFVSIERFILIHDCIHRVESPGIISKWIRDEIHQCTNSEGPLTPQQVLKWISIIVKSSKNLQCTWFDTIRAEFAHFLKSRRSISVFRDVQELEPLRIV